jgi:hypothetical protein
VCAHAYTSHRTGIDDSESDGLTTTFPSVTFHVNDRRERDECSSNKKQQRQSKASPQTDRPNKFLQTENERKSEGRNEKQWRGDWVLWRA